MDSPSLSSQESLDDMYCGPRRCLNSSVTISRLSTMTSSHIWYQDRKSTKIDAMDSPYGSPLANIHLFTGPSHSRPEHHNRRSHHLQLLKSMPSLMPIKSTVDKLSTAFSADESGRRLQSKTSLGLHFYDCPCGGHIKSTHGMDSTGLRTCNARVTAIVGSENSMLWRSQIQRISLGLLQSRQNRRLWVNLFLAPSQSHHESTSSSLHFRHQI